MAEENFFNKKESKTPAFKIPVKKDKKKSSKIVGTAVGAGAGAATVGLILNNETNKKIYEKNESVREAILKCIKDGKFTESELKEMRENGVLKTDGKDAVMDNYTDNLYNYLAKKENWKDGNFKATTEKQFLQEVSGAQENAIASLSISDRLKSGLKTKIETQSARTSIKEAAETLGISSDAVATAGVAVLAAAAVASAALIGKRVAGSFFKTRKREEIIRKSGEAQVVKQENALKAQQASVYMGTELSPSTQTEAVNAR